MVKRRTNRTAQDQGPGSRAQAVIERKAQGLFIAEPLASDLYWDALGVMAGLHWLLSPLRKRVQSLAQKYRHRPKVFCREFQEILELHITRLRATPEGLAGLDGLSWYKQEVGRHMQAINKSHPHTKPSVIEQPLALTQGLSQRKLDATQYLLPWLSSLIAGHPMKMEPKKLRAKIITLFSFRPGSEAYDITKEIRRIDSETRAKDRPLSDGEIAARVYQWYRQSKSSYYKSKARQAVKDARLPL